jgi:hypothetical protein
MELFASAQRVVKRHLVPTTRQTPATNLSPQDNFRLMRLISTTTCVDDDGRWWRIETRHCRYTGVVIRERRRITD